jgi:hypothetical protein
MESAEDVSLADRERPGDLPATQLLAVDEAVDGSFAGV